MNKLQSVGRLALLIWEMAWRIALVVAVAAAAALALYALAHLSGEEERKLQADEEACFPHVAMRIEEVCHCAVDDGWIQCEQSAAIRLIASEG